MCIRDRDDQEPELIAPFPGEIIFDVSDKAADEVGVVEEEEGGVDHALHDLGVLGHPSKRPVAVVGELGHDAAVVLDRV